MTERPVTVLRIIDRLNVGGPAIHAVLTSRGLDRSRFRTVLVTGSVEPGEADMSYLMEGAEIEQVTLPELGRELRPLRDLRTAWQLFQLMRQLRPTIVHTHKAKAGALGRVVALLAGLPIRVHTYHGHVFHGYFSPAKTRLFLTIERGLAHLTHRLVALSDGLVNELAQRYRIAPSDRFAVVPLGFNLVPFAECQQNRGRLRSVLGIGEAVRLVGIVGRMVPVKDHRTFVAAAAELAAERTDVEFVFIGGGELETELRADVAARNLGARCHFLGWRRDLDTLYPDLDVVALSSVNEGTPVALIEAMAAGVPVVGTSVGGVPDVLRHGARGELVPPGNPAALAQAIARALAPSALARAAAIRGDLIAEYGQARLCADLAALYEGLLATR